MPIRTIKIGAAMVRRKQTVLNGTYRRLRHRPTNLPNDRGLFAGTRSGRLDDTGIHGGKKRSQTAQRARAE